MGRRLLLSISAPWSTGAFRTAGDVEGRTRGRLSSASCSGPGRRAGPTVIPSSTSTATPLGPMLSELRRTCTVLGIPYVRGKGIVFHDTRYSAVTNLVGA